MENHLRSIELRDFERADMGETLDDATIEYFMKSQLGYALIDDEDKVILVFGGVMEREIAHTWMMTSERMFKHPVACLKLIVRAHMEGAERFGLKKFFTSNPVDAELENKYLRSIGYREHSRSTDYEDNKERIFFVKEVA